MKFKLEIKLGNDAMQLCGDVATSLRRVADTLESFRYTKLIEDPGLNILDTNGNIVGHWKVTK